MCRKGSAFGGGGLLAHRGEVGWGGAKVVGVELW